MQLVEVFSQQVLRGLKAWLQKPLMDKMGFNPRQKLQQQVKSN